MCIRDRGREIVPIQFLKALLPDPASLGPRTVGKTNIGCIFTGKKDGKEKTIYIYNVCDHQECYKEVGSQAISYTTGVPAMIGAALVVDKVWDKEDVYKRQAYVIEELLTGRQEISDQEAYYNEIIRSVIRTGRAAELVIAFCNLIRRLVVDHLHVVGDIFDRGPYPNLIMDTLMEHHSVDIQWGNHDVYWMGAASGSAACICNAVSYTHLQ